LFLTKLYEGESAQSEIGKTIQMAIELGKNPETKCQVSSFITAFGDFFGLQCIIGFGERMKELN